MDFQGALRLGVGEVGEEDELERVVLRCERSSGPSDICEDTLFTDPPGEEARGETFDELDEAQDDKVG